MSAGGPVVELPAEMRRALDAHVPAYEPWRLENYTAGIAWYAGEPTNAPLFGVAADFNGDGTQDVVLSGHDGRRELFFALISEGSSFRYVELREPRPKGPEPVVLGWFLVHQPAGRVEVPDSLGDDVVIEHDGFQWIYDGQASALYYWSGGEFVRVTTGD